ncbi:protein of unknown function DUF711 [Roseiflexus castenholzii DSM 13941]|uniref:DUF711 family protein n=2 Tax=Roseiflexus castenholzii TaxID=120962 RepID=A7NH83_ROSCS|nr:protein of unknown function DUF711 [Roseiflexus castenholzii DSM 13941]
MNVLQDEVCMRIRTLTVGACEDDVARVARAVQEARRRLEDAGYVVQTVRLALDTSGTNRYADVAAALRCAEVLALDAGFDYVSVGRVDVDRLASLAEALAATAIVFASARIAGRNGNVNAAATAAAARVVAALASATPNGFGNLRFAALASVAPGSPFFPASYHSGGEPWLAVGPEAAALAVEAAREIEDDGASASVQVVAARTRRFAESLAARIAEHDARIRGALQGVDEAYGIYVAGCDWSLAPHPDVTCSIGAAIECVSGVPFGEPGTLSVIRACTDAIRAARVMLVGFSGVMLPVLEDALLAQRNAEGRYGWRDLLAFSAVCGTGLDTIPLPGDASVGQIEGMLTEVAALAGALRKPLTARLMPIPGLRAGDMTAFDFPYFVNTRIMTI